MDNLEYDEEVYVLQYADNAFEHWKILGVYRDREKVLKIMNEVERAAYRVVATTLYK